MELNCYAVGQEVLISAELYGHKFLFRRECENDGIARMLSSQILCAMERRIIEIRKQAYRDGKRAARDKSRKIAEDDFFGCVNEHNTGWWEAND